MTVVEERSHSGLVQLTANELTLYRVRGFDSHPLRSSNYAALFALIPLGARQGYPLREFSSFPPSRLLRSLHQA